MSYVLYDKCHIVVFQGWVRLELTLSKYLHPLSRFLVSGNHSVPTETLSGCSLLGASVPTVINGLLHTFFRYATSPEKLQYSFVNDNNILPAYYYLSIWRMSYLFMTNVILWNISQSGLTGDFYSYSHPGFEPELILPYTGIDTAYLLVLAQPAQTRTNRTFVLCV